MNKFFTIMLLFFTLQVLATPASDLNSLLTSMTSLRANYIQTTTDPKFNDQKIVEGKAMLARPNQFRWEIEKPYQQLLISDGKTLWIYDADLEQATVQTLKGNLKDTPALLLAGDPGAIIKHFTVHSTDAGFGEKTFELKPLDENSLVRAVKLTFKGSIISNMTLIDNLHQVVEFQFSQIKINENLSPKLFRFNPPSGVDVIREDE